VHRASIIEKRDVEHALTLDFTFGERPGPEGKGEREDGSGRVQVAFVWLPTQGLRENFQLWI
jgi:hypothetical protein